MRFTTVALLVATGFVAAVPRPDDAGNGGVDVLKARSVPPSSTSTSSSSSSTTTTTTTSVPSLVHTFTSVTTTTTTVLSTTIFVVNEDSRRTKSSTTSSTTTPTSSTTSKTTSSTTSTSSTKTSSTSSTSSSKTSSTSSTSSSKTSSTSSTSSSKTSSTSSTSTTTSKSTSTGPTTTTTTSKSSSSTTTTPSTSSTTTTGSTTTTPTSSSTSKTTSLSSSSTSASTSPTSSTSKTTTSSSTLTNTSTTTSPTSTTSKTSTSASTSSSSSSATSSSSSTTKSSITTTSSTVTQSSTSGYWYANIQHNGISPFIPNGKNWTVYRNVKDFGAKGDGKTDDSAAIQAAINFANATASRGNNAFGETVQPAVVYIPAGVYLIGTPIQSYVDNVIMGDPLNPPTLKAMASLPSKAGFIWYAKDPGLDATNNFFISMKNLILDSTLVAPATTINLLDWSISQAVQLNNVVFNMPIGATGHAGIQMYEGGSPLYMSDLVFQGGNIGMGMIEQQYHLRGITFKNVITGIMFYHLFEGVAQGLVFDGCQVGLNNSGNATGFFALIDSSATNTPVLLSTVNSTTTDGSIVLENVAVDSTVGATVQIGGAKALTGSVPAGTSWILGDVYTPSSSAKTRAQGKTFHAGRPASLVDATGTYRIAKAPTYQEYDVSQVVNVKSVSGLPVYGDGVADDTANLQAIINSAAGNKVVFFPHGTYLVSSTLVIPAGTRIHGEVWSTISATGANFANEQQPTPLVQVGQPGSTGVAQFVDMLFTVADILPGAVLVEVNMAGNTPGDVGFYNSHFRIGGGRGSKVQTSCGDPATCRAARLCAHLTTTSSSYWENSWCWSADHDLDDNYSQNPSTAGGFLVESTKATWLLGIGSEHNDLYQMNIYNAQNVFLGFQQSESPYWQGPGSDVLTPQPWQNSLLASDPDFSWCATGDSLCRMALYQYINNSTGVNAYGGGFWNFFNGLNRDACTNCQQNAVLYANNKDFYSYGINTHNVQTLILDGDGGQYKALATQADNSGGWGGVVAAYLPSLT